MFRGATPARRARSGRSRRPRTGPRASASAGQSTPARPLRTGPAGASTAARAPPAPSSPREPRVQALQKPPGGAAPDLQRDLIDDIGRQRAQMEEELIERGEGPESAFAQPREIGPVELEDVDGAIVRPPAQGHAGRFIERFALRELETAEQVVVQREAEIERARLRGADGGGRLLRLVGDAPPARAAPCSFPSL